MIYKETKEYSWHGERQDMSGFDNRYKNIVDYILKITEEIWEDKQVELIYDTYLNGIEMHSGRQLVKGVEEIVEGTKSTLKSFPDRKMKGEAVIWAEEKDGSFYTSHRIGSTATNLGDTVYGKATGKKVFFRTIADCCVAENRIFEEWLVRDNLHLIQQLGFDPIEMAKRDPRYKDKTLGLIKAEEGIVAGKSQSDLSEPNNVIIAMFSDVWKTKNFDKLQNYYEDGSTIHAICEQDLKGVSALKKYAEDLLASFSKTEITLERLSSNRVGDAYEVAARWKITGINDSKGFFGEPCGKPLVLPVISHYILKGGKITEEWMVFDGFDALCQMYADTAPVFSENGFSENLRSQHKQMILDFFNESDRAVSEKETKMVLQEYLANDIVLNSTEPYNEMVGIGSYMSDFWQPLLHSFPDLENQPYILIGGEYEGRSYVSCTGNFMGTFKNAWHEIAPTNQPVNLRYAGHFLIENNKIVKAWFFFDMLDVMRQAGFHFFPSRGIEHVPPGPKTEDGIVTYKTKLEEGQKSIDLTNAMLNALGEYDGVTLHSMDQTRFWDVENMMWYGPSGIGTTKGLKDFENKHQLPFITAFPDRGITEKVGKDYFSQLGDGNYSCDFGFPAMYGTHNGDGWLGLKATGKEITLRVVDYWRREGDQLKENWVFIDMVHVLKQLGINIFELLEKEY